MRKCALCRRTGVVKGLAERVDQGVLRWFGHVQRMEEEHLVKKTARADVIGVRPRGRPRMGWIDGVRRALDTRGMTVEQGIVRDRSDWRAVVNA